MIRIRERPRDPNGKARGPMDFSSSDEDSDWDDTSSISDPPGVRIVKRT